MTHQARAAGELASAYKEIWNDRDYDRIPDVVSDSFVMVDPAAPEDGVPGPAGEVHGPDGLKAFIRGVADAFPDFQVEPIDLLVGEDVVMMEADYSLTHEGEFRGISPTGRTIEFRGMAKLAIGDGKIQRHTVYLDTDAYRALGMLAE